MRKLAHGQVLVSQYIYVEARLFTVKTSHSSCSSQSNVLRHGFVCQKLHIENDLQIKVVLLYIVSGTSMGSYIQTRPPMLKLAHGHVS